MDIDLDPSRLDGIPAEKPTVAIALAAVVAIVVYIVVQLVLDGGVDPVETIAFTIVFTGAYAAFLFLRRRMQAA